MITLSERLRQLRENAGYSREAIGAQGFVSTPGWIKIENSQRSPSEDLLKKFVDFLVAHKAVRRGEGEALKIELLTLKYLGSRHAFVRELAGTYALAHDWGLRLLFAVGPGKIRPRQRRKPAGQ